jgi:hypothetical protein
MPSGRSFSFCSTVSPFTTRFGRGKKSGGMGGTSRSLTLSSRLMPCVRGCEPKEVRWRENITSGASAAFSAFMTSGRDLAEEGRRRAEEGREEMEVVGNSEDNFAPNTEVDWVGYARGRVGVATGVATAWTWYCVGEKKVSSGQEADE